MLFGGPLHDACSDLFVRNSKMHCFLAWFIYFLPTVAFGEVSVPFGGCWLGGLVLGGHKQ